MRTTSGAWEILQIEVKCEQYEVSTCPHSRKDMIFLFRPLPPRSVLSYKSTDGQFSHFCRYSIVVKCWIGIVSCANRKDISRKAMSLKNDSDPLLPCALEITQFVRACMTDKKAWNRKCTKTKFNVISVTRQTLPVSN